MESTTVTETSRLLQNHHDDEDTLIPRASASAKDVRAVAVAVLPIPLLSALAMAATSATTIYAYADLTCKDATHCEDDERKRYTASVAIAVTIANLCALLAIGTIAKVSERNHKAGLAAWIICRAMNVATLAVGVYVRSIGIAVCGQIFEGLASDNILHLNLNAIYVQVSRPGTVAKLIGSSLALFMIGISISPSIASLLENFQASFVLAALLFAAALLYLLTCVPNSSARSIKARKVTFEAGTLSTGGEIRHHHGFGLVKNAFAPLSLLLGKPLTMIPAISLFMYNMIQSYSFYAIMVYTSTQFGFSNRQNGYVVSIAHATASVYLLLTLFAGPFLLRWIRRETSEESTCTDRSLRRKDGMLAVSCMTIQALALLCLGFATQVWQLYAIVTLCALGLATPSFVKSYFVSLFEKSEDPQAIAALAIMETLGALLAPTVLGGLQVIWPGRGVFLFASAVVGLAAVVFTGGLIALEIQRKTNVGDRQIR